MKFLNLFPIMSIYSGSQAAFSPALADTLDQFSTEIEPKKFSTIIDMAFNKLQNHPKFLTRYSQKKTKRKVFHQMIGKYGCHCFPGYNGNTAGARGQVRDALDQLCQNLNRCHKCVNFDFPEQCDFANGKYKYFILREVDPTGSNSVSDNDSVEIKCADREKADPCKHHQCECDKEFAENLYRLWIGQHELDLDWEFNEDFWLNEKYINHVEMWNQKVVRGDNGLPAGAGLKTLFDRDSSCLYSQMNSKPDACCGRNLYNSLEKKCCVSAGKAYNEVYESCCESRGEVVSFGQQCV